MEEADKVQSEAMRRENPHPLQPNGDGSPSKGAGRTGTHIKDVSAKGAQPWQKTQTALGHPVRQEAAATKRPGATTALRQ